MKNLKVLQDKLPASVYKLLTSSNIEDYAAISKVEWAAARSYLVPQYSYGFVPVAVEPIPDAILNLLEECKVCVSEFGYSMKFSFIIGEPAFIPCSIDLWKEGEEWDPDDIQILKLRKGKDFIYRVYPASKQVTLYENYEADEEEQKFRESVWSVLVNLKHKYNKSKGIIPDIFEDLRLY